MATIVQRIRNIIAAESDNFYDDSVLLDYSNETKEAVLSFLLLKEYNGRKGVRALDELRTVAEIELTGPPDEVGQYFRHRVAKPANIREILSIRKDLVVPVREMTNNKLFELTSGNVFPVASENYYAIVNNLLEIYTDSGGSADLEVFFIQNPSPLLSTSKDLIDLPDRLINSVVYGGAHLALLQEGFESEGDISTANKFQEKFDRELQLNGY